MKRIILSIFGLIAMASNAQQAQRLPLKEAINYALQHKAEAEKARLNVEKSNYQIQEVRANALPNVAVTGGLIYNPKLQATYVDGSTFGAPGVLKLELGQKWTSQANAQLTQLLFNQTVFIGLKAARTTREFYQLNQELTENQIIEKVASSYYQVYQAQKTLENIENNLVLTQKTVKIIEELYKSGLAKKIDLDRALVSVNNLKSAQQQGKNGLQLAKNALKFMIGMPIEQEISLPDEAFEPNYNLAFEKENATQRIEIQTLEKQRSLLEINVKTKRSAYYPSLVLVGNYGWLGMGPKNPLFFGEKDKVYWSDFSSIGLNVSIPVFSGFGTRAKVKQAQIELQQLEADLKDTRLAMDLAYENARNQITNSLLTIETQKENAKLAEEVLTNTQNNYAQGLATLTDLLDAERSLADAKNNYTNAVLQYKLAEIEMLKAQGKLKTIGD
ncbi:TolC family protein [Capnocytophaga sp.]|uniref:TolC family protein n=1 Tax=Capnocytophaga sp. TaxID=44737 RepID=UPI0026DAB68D|nr:TolC family protein [Capnocytophaga sp.]MDO5105372.1 TolC family protein [Capnocytophaga sp.]